MIIIYPLGLSRPWWITVSNIDHDDQSGLIVASHGVANMMIFEGLNDGLFRSSMRYELGPDFNHDGVQDMDLVDPLFNQLVIFRSNGNVREHVIDRYSTDTGAYPTSLVVVDFDGDDELDIVVVSAATRPIEIFLQTHNDTFVRHSLEPGIPGSWFSSVETVGLTKDS